MWNAFRDRFIPNVIRKDLTLVMDELLTQLETQEKQLRHAIKEDFLTALQDAETRLAGLVDKASTSMAAAIAMIQKDMADLKAAVAANDTTSDAVAVNAAADKLQASVDALSAVVESTVPGSTSPAPSSSPAAAPAQAPAAPAAPAA